MRTNYLTITVPQNSYLVARKAFILSAVDRLRGRYGHLAVSNHINTIRKAADNRFHGNRWN